MGARKWLTLGLPPPRSRSSLHTSGFQVAKTSKYGGDAEENAAENIFIKKGNGRLPDGEILSIAQLPEGLLLSDSKISSCE